MTEDYVVSRRFSLCSFILTIIFSIFFIIVTFFMLPNQTRQFILTDYIRTGLCIFAAIVILLQNGIAYFKKSVIVFAHQKEKYTFLVLYVFYILLLMCSIGIYSYDVLVKPDGFASCITFCICMLIGCNFESMPHKSI